MFRGDADECQKQFCFVFRICLAFFNSRLWRPLENEAKNDRNGPHKSSKKVHKAIIGSTNESDNNRAIVKDNANELAIIITAIIELAATVAGLAQRMSNNTQQVNCSHNPADEDGEEGEDESIIEPPPKRAREDAPGTPNPDDSGSGLMDALAKEFNVKEKCRGGQRKVSRSGYKHFGQRHR